MSGFFTSMISSICGNIRSTSKASSPSAKRRSTQCALVGLMHHRPNQLKTRNAPGTSFEPYPIPVLADPKKLIRALDGLRSLKTFPSADAVNTTTGPQLPQPVSNSFGSLDQTLGDIVKSCLSGTGASVPLPPAKSSTINAPNSSG